jgi:hypothetical protein
MSPSRDETVEVNGIIFEVGTMTFTGLDDCIIGMSTHFNPNGFREDLPTYDYQKMIDHFYQEFKYSCDDHESGKECEADHYMEAIEWIDFNILGMYAEKDGHCMPIILMERCDEKQAGYGGTD